MQPQPKPPPIQLLVLRGFRRLGWALILFQITAAASAEEYATGYVPDDPATYAATPQAPRYRAWVPPEKDLSGWFPTPGKQGRQGSCGAWATAYAARAYYAARGRGLAPKDLSDQFSPSYIYNQIKFDSCASGSRIGDALKLMQKQGAASWPDFPYDPADCSRQPDNAVTAKAARFRIDDYERVDASDLGQLKEQIAEGNPVIFGMDVTPEFYRLKRGIYSDLSPSDIGRNGHAMVLVGYSDPKQAFKVINSWGPLWGEGGFGWVSYAALEKRIVQAWVIKPKPEETRPPETPIPAPLVQPRPTPKPPTPTLDNPALDRLLRDVTGPELCGEIHGQMHGGQQVTLSGFAGRTRDIAPLEQALKARGIGVIRQIDIRPWPQCEVLVNLREPMTQPKGLKVNVTGTSAADLARGETITIEVTTPNTPSYLYLTYVQADGHAVHLTSPKGSRAEPIAPNTRLIFGDGQAGRDHYKVGPPYGPEVVVAIATPQPLFNTALPPRQIERDYLNQFREALHGRGAAAAVATLTTHD